MKLKWIQRFNDLFFRFTTKQKKRKSDSPFSPDSTGNDVQVVFITISLSPFFCVATKSNSIHLDADV